jgi:RNA polymerase primary sigma factor
MVLSTPPRPGAHRRRERTRRGHPARAGRARSEQELVLAARRGDIAARTELVETFMPLIGSVARAYRGSTAVQRNELMQEGVAGLLTALQRFDPARGTPFWGYAAWWVRQAMQQVVAELTRPVVMSDRALRQLARVRDARRVLVHANGAWPTSIELAAETGLAREQVEHLLAVERVPQALDGGRAGANDDEHPHSGETLLEDPAAEEAYDGVLSRIECDRISSLLDRLETRERAILRARYGLDGQEQTLREIARGLGLSAERVRQLEHQALDELRVAAVAG